MRTSPAGAAGHRLLTRALFFAGALVLLFVAVQLAPTAASEAPAYADAAGTVAAKAEPARPRSPSLLSPGYLVALALLAGGGYWALHLRRTRGPVRDEAALVPLGHLALGPNASTRLVRCGGEVLLLGVGGGSVTLLKTYPADAFADAPAEVPAPAASLAGSAFADVLQRYAPSAHPQAPYTR